MKNTRKKMLLSSVAMLLVALVALGSATYAWFTVNKEVTADKMKVKAATAAGLQITGKNGGVDANWVRDYEFTLAEQTLTPTSRGFTESGITGTTGFLPGEVKTTGSGARAWSSGDTNTVDWAADLGRPTVNTSAGTEASAANANYAEYRVGVRSSGSDISGVKMNVEFTEGTKANASKFIRVLVLDESDSNKVKYVIAEGGAGTNAVTAINGTSKMPTTAVAQQDSTGSDYSVGTVTKDTPKFYRIVVWYEGQDDDCIDTNQSADGTVKIKFYF